MKPGNHQRHYRQWVFVLLAVTGLSSSMSECSAQTGYPNYGFRSYCNTGRRNYNSGIGGCSTNNSFDSGFSGYTSNGMAYNTQRSTQAAQQLAHEASAIWNSMPVGRALTQAARESQGTQQGTQQASQGPSYMLPGANVPQGQQSQQAPTMNGLIPPMSRQDMLRIFLEGGTPGSPGSPAPSGNTSGADSTAYSNYQTAENEASKARNAEQRVRYYDTETWSRKNDASTAEYAANNANYAAQRAESAAYNGDSQARGYASQARAAANRARQSANQARYNANTMRGGPQ
jgi:hypothetical protein